jgi:HTH-type transcriptional regulator/antitoxin MqsA
MPQPMTCHECGSAMVRDTRPMTFTYKGRSVEVDQPGFYCTACDESVHSGDDIQATEPAVMAFKSDVDEVFAKLESAKGPTIS